MFLLLNTVLQKTVLLLFFDMELCMLDQGIILNYRFSTLLCSLNLNNILPQSWTVNCHICTVNYWIKTTGEKCIQSYCYKGPVTPAFKNGNTLQQNQFISMELFAKILETTIDLIEFAPLTNSKLSWQCWPLEKSSSSTVMETTVVY